MSNVTITKMTTELAYELYDGYEYDLMTYANEAYFKPFVYSKQWVDEYLSKQARLNHILFVIMLGDTPIGEIKLHNVSKKRRTCDVGMFIKKDIYKNKGYGTEALKQAIQYAKDELSMKAMVARTIVKNERSQRVLKKVGFLESYREDGIVYLENELDKVIEIKPIRIVPMTRELYHQFEKGFLVDLPPKGYREGFRQYVYDEETVDCCYRLDQLCRRDMFAIMIDDKPVGKVALEGVDYEEGSCTVECQMQSREYKNRGYGRKAILAILRYARDELGLTSAKARVDIDDTHGQHVLEKLGFEIKKVVKDDRYHDGEIYYEILF